MKSILKILFSILNIYKKREKSVVAFIRTDNIGDYILFRNLLPYIRYSKEYRNKKIILIGNIAWQELAEHFDSEYVDIFFWIHPPQYIENKWYRIKTLWRLNKLHIHTLINTVHSRDWIIDDIVSFNSAQMKITCQGDDINLDFELKKQTDTFFYTLLPSLPTSSFEFYRNHFFIEKLISESINLKRPFFLYDKKINDDNCISLFIGAQSHLRRWSPTKFAYLIITIHKKFPNYFYQILGGKDDITNSQVIMDLITKTPNAIKINNLCGQTTLVDLVTCIRKSRLLISNETSAIHIAAAVKTQSICIANGERYLRFSPYPVSMTNKIITVFPDNSFYEISNQGIYAEKFRYKSDIDIDSISIERVFQFIKTIL